MAARFGQPRFSPLRPPLGFGEQQALTASPMQQGVAQLKAAAPPAAAVPKGVGVPLAGILRNRKRRALGAFYGQ
jgi:hypothetical protein